MHIWWRKKKQKLFPKENECSAGVFKDSPYLTPLEILKTISTFFFLFRKIDNLLYVFK